MMTTQLEMCLQLQMQLIFTWIYGLFLGGYQYSLKIYVFQKVLTNYHFIYVDKLHWCLIAIFTQMFGIILSPPIASHP